MIGCITWHTAASIQCTCSISLSITRFFEFSNIIDMHDRMVTIIIIQSKYDTMPSRWLKWKYNTLTVNTIAITATIFTNWMLRKQWIVARTYCNWRYLVFTSLPVTGSCLIYWYRALTINWHSLRKRLSRPIANKGVSKYGWFSRKSSSCFVLINRTSNARANYYTYQTGIQDKIKTYNGRRVPRLPFQFGFVLLLLQDLNVEIIVLTFVSCGSTHVTAIFTRCKPQSETSLF